MYVRKFEADSLDEALRSVKSELGPDAIILKTITNKGLKGAFKKSRVEITAAISEHNFEKKAKVDKALGENKERFYQAPSSSINNMINEYNDHAPKEQSQNGGYGSMGLNKVVNTVSKASHKFKNSLDEFLTTEEESSGGFDDFMDAQDQDEYRVSDEQSELSRDVRDEEAELESFQSANAESAQYEKHEKKGPNDYEMRLKAQLDSQKKQIEILEKKLFELAKNASVGQQREEDENRGLKDLRDSLRTLDLNESIVSFIVKKARFELSREDQQDEDALFDFALRELNAMINVEMPLFSRVSEKRGDEAPVVTALVSEVSSGQTSMAMKLAVLMEDVKIIRLRESAAEKVKNEFAQSVFNLDIANVETLSHLMTEARKALEEKRQVILDIKVNAGKEDESKKVLDTLNRSFKNIEILANISAIHSELYNRKILSKYKDRFDGVIISYVDQCLNYGALVNTHCKHNNLPLKFFGTGPTVPDDIEGASAERILAGMFNL